MAIANMKVDDLYILMTSRQRDELYRKLWYDYVYDDVRSFLEDYDGNIPETQEGIDNLVDRVTRAYVYDGTYDCNLSYWQNIENLVRENYCIG